MVFKPRSFNLKCPDINRNLNKLAYVKEAKYLGVIICSDLKDDGDILRHLIFMLGQIALSENFTTVPWVLNYICFMRIVVVQLIVANYGLRVLI